MQFSDAPKITCLGRIKDAKKIINNFYLLKIVGRGGALWTVGITLYYGIEQVGVDAPCFTLTDTTTINDQITTKTSLIRFVNEIVCVKCFFSELLTAVDEKSVYFPHRQRLALR